MSVDRQGGSSHLYQWDIHLSLCLPPCGSLELFACCRNIRQLNYEVIKNISSQIYSVECGEIFFASQTTRDMEMPSCRDRDTNMSFFHKGENAISQWNWGSNQLIATALYCDRTDLIPILTFYNTACCIQLHSWSINPKFIQLLDKHLTSNYLYFPNLNIHKNAEFFKGLGLV